MRRRAKIMMHSAWQTLWQFADPSGAAQLESVESTAWTADGSVQCNLRASGWGPVVVGPKRPSHEPRSPREQRGVAAACNVQRATFTRSVR